MNRLFSRPPRPGLLAVGLLSCMMAPVAAGAVPMAPVEAPAPAIVQVRDAPVESPNRWIPRRNHGNWNRGDNHWNRNGQWNNGGRYRRGDPRYWHGSPGRWRGDSWRYGGSGIYLGLGMLPDYYPGYYPGYDYYDAPRYVVVPRRHYRSLSSAHVRWCYDRYRSYRAWDNSWQPYYGPRRQCRSPYG